jgi:hypothetical protein
VRLWSMLYLWLARLRRGVFHQPAAAERLSSGYRG